MGSYEVAEACVLVGAFLLHSIAEKYGNTFGLDRDDGPGMLKDTASNIDIIKNGQCKLFQEHSLRITIEVKKKP